MCGITGFVYNSDRAVERDVLERMNCAIEHRGPDEDGFYIKENVGLAMRRLSIIDLAGGQQPMHTEDRTKWIVYNGEIYNYRELREDLDKRGHTFYTNSDTEAIVHLYDEFGEGCLEYLRGMFAFAIWDESDQSLFIARDRVGKKPLLYSHQPNGDLIYGSEFRAVLEHPSVSRDVDLGAIDSYLTYLCVPAPETAFQSIRKLEPGHWLRWKDGQIETKRYWQPDFSKKIKIGKVVAVKQDAFADIGAEENKKFKTIFQLDFGDENEFPFKNGWLINISQILETTDLKKVEAVTINKINDRKKAAKQLKKIFNPEIESMEGAAFHFVCLQQDIPFIQVRGISNKVGERDKAKWNMKDAIENLNNELQKITVSINNQ